MVFYPAHACAVRKSTHWRSYELKDAFTTKTAIHMMFENNPLLLQKKTCREKEQHRQTYLYSKEYNGQSYRIHLYYFGDNILILFSSYFIFLHSTKVPDISPLLKDICTYYHKFQNKQNTFQNAV